jgi:hypothetical protein
MGIYLDRPDGFARYSYVADYVQHAWRTRTVQVEERRKTSGCTRRIAIPTRPRTPTQPRPSRRFSSSR